MLCPHCGNSGLTPGGTCPACGKTQATARTVAASTLTPPPPDPQTPYPTGLSSADAETQLDSTGRPTITAATGTLPLGEPFGRRYRILKVLGQGGMGVVYQAWDEELGLAVALKTIRPEVMSDPITAADVERRFKRELLLARQVTHRHVVRIHDLGEVDGVKYLTMPFIEGQTLSSVLTHSGKLPCGRALQIIREISDGLMAAHGVGVVHRDLKPENVMLDGDGRAVIMDFGISRSLTGTGAGTMMGSVVGTLEYMSPEQARGETADQRSDIYALGLMLYDMLVGRRRFAVGTSPLSEAMSRMTHAPPPVRSLEAAVPDPVERIVNRCLEPDAGKRYQTVAELIADLDRLEPDGHERPLPSKPRIVPEFAASWPKPAQFAVLAAIALLALAPLAMIAIMVVNSMQQPPATPAAARAPLSILIADFQNLANDPVFDGSLEQVLAIAMEGAPFITTFPRRDALTAARAAQGSPIDRLDVETARLVSQREGIKVVLAGSVASEGRGYRVDVRAVDAFKGEELANASRSASSKENVLQAMAAVASDVRQALGDVTPESERLAQAETFTSGKLDAAREYGIAQQLSSNGKYQESIQHYKRATEIDPDFGRAYATWAVSEFTLGRPKEAEELYKKAFTLLDRMTKREEHRTVGTYYLSVAKDYDKAVENFSTLVREYPADRAGHSNLALSYFYTRNFAKALEHGHGATEIYGTSPKFRSNNALYAMYAGDFATAGRDASELVRDHPTYYRGYLPIAMAAIAGAKPDEARTAYETMAKVGGDQGASLGDMGLADLAMYHGEYEKAVPILTAGIARDERIKNPAAQAAKLVALAEATLALGNQAEALAAVKRAMELTRDPSVLVPSARVLIAAGRSREANDIAAELRQLPQATVRAYEKMLQAEIAMSQKQNADAQLEIDGALKLADLWMVRLASGIAGVQSGKDVQYVAARDDLKKCLDRRGEATSVFLDDVPSIRYLAPVHYWLGRALEGLNKDQAAESYRTFLTLRSAGSRDPLATDARRRLGT
jgi:tetratricopeptide (TPR) repeat protein/tRNA A-37 threonylcarbamoyl transferase component Bud32